MMAFQVVQVIGFFLARDFGGQLNPENLFHFFKVEGRAEISCANLALDPAT
jgi:hypothetical protein